MSNVTREIANRQRLRRYKARKRLRIAISIAFVVVVILCMLGEYSIDAQNEKVSWLCTVACFVIEFAAIILLMLDLERYNSMEYEKYALEEEGLL